ncbi:MAG: beta strand repeat-containing protein, partial [Actinomycetota bacterium]
TDTVTASITGSASVNVTVPDLTISKTHTGNFTQGQIGAAYTITVSNAGAAPTSGTVSVVDTLPAGLIIHRGVGSLVGTGWTCDSLTLTCTRADALAAGASYPAITLTVDVDPNAPATVTNSVSVSGGGEANTANDTATDPTTITQVADLTIAKSHTGNFTQGQTGAQYTLTASNVGPGPTNGTVTVTDTLPSGLTATAISGTGWTCVLATLSCTRSDVLAAGAAYPAITLTVDVASTAPATLANSATIFGGGELNAANDTATDVTTIIQLADLTLSKTHTGTFTQGQAGATYQITVSNVGASASSGTVTVVDSLPAGLTATAISGTGWSCVLASVTCTRTDALVINTAFPAITVTVDVAANAPGSVTNTATVSGGGEANTANDTATDVTQITQVADLTLSKSHNGNFVQGQTGAAYFLNVNNFGPGPASGAVTVTDSLPAGLTATAISGSGWTCVLGTLTCTRSDALPVNGSYSTITLTVDVAANAPASVTNTATVSGGGELNTANDTASDVTIISPAPDLTLSSTHTGNFIQGQTGATYTLTVSNAGPGVTSGTVTVTDTLPAGLTATSIAGSGWTCVPASLTCTRADALAANGSYPAIAVTVNVAANASASVTNTATVSGGAEINTANDVATDLTTIVPLADLTITKTHNGTLSLGQTGATYTIAVTNSGQGPTAGTVSVVDNLPASGLTATAISGTGWTCVLATLTCTRADVLSAGASYPGITVTVNIALNAPSPVSNTATVSGGGELNTSNDAASDSANLGPPASLVTSGSSSATVAAGSAASFSFSFTSNQATAVTFSCSGLPSAAACSFNPPSTNSTSAQVAMTISTTASSGTMATRWSPRGPNLYIPVFAILGLPLLPLIMRRKLALRWGLGWAGLMFVLALAGCGGSPTPPPPPHVTGTPAGTYQITATATGTGFQTSSVVTLTVR